MPLTGFNHAITWGEFQTRTTRPSGAGDEDAEIHTAAPSSYNYSSRNGRFSVTDVTTEITVDTNLSWVLRNGRTADLLRHEQGHYDIQALGARETYSRVGRLTAASEADLARQVRAIEREVQRKVDDKNARYDTQTNHSRNAAEQRNWEATIRRAKDSPTGTLDLLP